MAEGALVVETAVIVVDISRLILGAKAKMGYWGGRRVFVLQEASLVLWQRNLDKRIARNINITETMVRTHSTLDTVILFHVCYFTIIFSSIPRP
jgi:hypothetical protein